MSSSIPGITTGASSTDRRHKPWKDGSLNSYVPVWTPLPEGQWIDGKIDVPNRLAFAPEHTNAALERAALIRANIERWVAWRAAKGWYINTAPTISGPTAPPVSGSAKQAQFDARAASVIGRGQSVAFKEVLQEADDISWYMVRARFIRHDPLYISLEDVLEMRRLAAAYEVDITADFLPETTHAAPVAYMEVDGGLDALAEAEKRRAAHGLNRADYLIGKLSDPL